MDEQMQMNMEPPLSIIDKINEDYKEAIKESERVYSDELQKAFVAIEKRELETMRKSADESPRKI